MFLLLAALAFVFTEIGRTVYRPYVFSRGIGDGGLAGSIGNLGGIIVQIFFTLAVINPSRRLSYGLAAFLAGGYVVYEFIQRVLPGSTYDWMDIAATLTGYVFSVALLALVWRRWPEVNPAMDAGNGR